MARVFLTASAGGLGHAAARTLLDDGHDVVVHVRSSEHLTAVAALDRGTRTTSASDTRRRDGSLPATNRGSWPPAATGTTSGRAVQELLRWFGKLPDIDETGIGFVVAHPGGPRIVDRLVQELGCNPGLLDPSRQSLQEVGNTGAVSILDVLARTYASPPPPGAHGLAIGIGPGVTVSAAHFIWR
ncbi:3-oxoacyl-[acyl-carrier-protein] synthase III C-terminal domain-containing protein [Amycolatopsis sp. NPDC051371]|uniref:3-oxoacyl-[acyl-carrier-protein] synthase III C-terminal domain-containing protein n=1 Tax=Amycolatopsis sp. NPDC051371 TaxID=3155800 RepID=UPI0034408BEE